MTRYSRCRNSQMWTSVPQVLNVNRACRQGSPITVADDFGDVYGIYYGLSIDEGVHLVELRDWAQR